MSVRATRRYHAPVMSEKVIVLTGAASGIGRHLALSLTRLGHRVLATDLVLGRLDEVAHEDRWPDTIVRAKLDVTREEDFRAALAVACSRFGRVDVLLAVAGFLAVEPAWGADQKTVDLTFDVNVKGVVHGTRVFGTYFVEQKRGHIINFGSLASLAPAPGIALYCASKFAVRGFSLAAAQELAPHGVAVSLVMPDAVRTPMLDKQVDHPAAALTFSGNAPLEVADIERVLVTEVFEKRPLEIAIPWERGLLARLANTEPRLAFALGPMLTKKGLAQQARERARRVKS